MGRFKIISILFIIMVFLMTFAFTRDKKVDELNVVTDNEITNYKELLLNTYNKYGYKLTEEDVNQKVQEYKDIEISIAKSKAKGMEFKKALKISLIVSFICCFGLYLLRLILKLHYGELLGGPLSSDRLTDDTEIIREKQEYDLFITSRKFLRKFLRK